MAAPATPVQTSHFEIPDGNWLEALIIAALFGALGSMATAARQRRDDERLRLTSTTNDPFFKSVPQINFVIEILNAGFCGAMTAVCGLFVIVLSPLTGSLAPGAFWVFLAGVSATLGIASDRILPAIQKNTFRRLGLLEEEVAQNRVTLQTNTGLDAVERALDDAFLPAAIPSDITRGIERTENYLKKDRIARRPTIRLGRLYFEKRKDRQKAINVLSSFISFCEQKSDVELGPSATKNLADVLYNRACYRLTKPDDESYSPTEAEIDSASEDLKRSLMLSKENIEDARVDKDLKYLREHSADIAALLK